MFFQTEYKSQSFCVYLGDYNGDGITDFAYQRCMTPYIMTGGSQEPSLFICLSNKDIQRPDKNETCFRAAFESNQNELGLKLNKMPDLNRDGLTDLVSFHHDSEIHFHLNRFTRSTINRPIDLLFKQSESDFVKVNDFRCDDS